MSSELPGFEIIEKIGAGGMADVWKARQLSLDRLVAIKVLTNQSLPDEEARERFHTEAKAAARINHPGIVQVYDAGEKNSVPYYVMEYVEGKTVGDLLAEHKHLPEENALIIAECVAIALGHAWKSARVVHCDIKPDNVLVAKDGTIKIADLGLARIMGPRGDQKDSELVLGTPNYTSPEQAEGLPDLDCRADIYSLGAMLYHMTTGAMPFSGSAGSSAMDLQISGFLADPLDVRAELHPATAWLIEKMMVKDRNLRHQDWDEVLADVKAVQKKRMPSAPYPEPGQSTVRRSSARGTPPPPTSPPVKKIIAPTESTKKKFVVSKDGIAGPSFPTAEPPSMGRALVVVGFLAFLNLAVYGYIFSPFLPSPAPIIPPPPVAPLESPMPSETSEPPVANEPLPPRTTRLSAEESRAILNPAPKVTKAPEPETETFVENVGEPGTTVKWNDAEFARAAKLYNDALADYTTFQKTRANRTVLTQVEKNCREAIRIFEACRARAPKGMDLQPFIDDCFHLISDVRHSTQIGAK